MTGPEIEAIQRRIGTKPDRFWGAKSTAACQAHLKAMMPWPNPWPSQSQAALQGFYGSPGDESQLVSIDVTGLGVRFDGAAVRSIRVHHKCAESLLRVLREIAASPFRYVLAEYAGTYNNRPMRGGTLPSLHARGAAIDLMPATNRNHQHWPTSANMPIEVMEMFAREGWLSAGAFWSRDSMHFQATK
jgi:hypothetical protein